MRAAPVLLVVGGATVATLAVLAVVVAVARGAKETVTDSGIVNREVPGGEYGYLWELREYKGRYGAFWFDPDREIWRAFGFEVWWPAQDKDRLRANLLEMLRTQPVSDFSGMNAWPVGEVPG